MLRRVLLYSFYITYILAFKWHISDPLPPMNVLTYSEKYMFATQDGPTMLEQGDAYIHVKNKIKLHTLRNESVRVTYTIYAAAEEDKTNTYERCSEYTNDWALDSFQRTMQTRFVAASPRRDGKNGSEYLWEAEMDQRYTVNLEAWHSVAYQVCDYDGIVDRASLRGEVIFRNPYGYLPAEMYGFLPFEGARMAAFAILTVYFLFYFWRHLDSVLPLHVFALLVLLIALLEATVTYAAYQILNLTGQPYCCPFPKIVIASLVLEVIRQTVARVLLLVVCLGYGVGRAKLVKLEIWAICAVSVLYFIAALANQVSTIVDLDMRHASSSNSSAYGAFELFMDVIILSWIYMSLVTTIRILSDYRQEEKVKYYKSLYHTIVIFVCLFAVVSILYALHKFGVVPWPWQWAWVPEVTWQILNFSVLACACLISRPSDTSRELAYAFQLPTSDPDDDDTEAQDTSIGIELAETDQKFSDRRHVSSSHRARNGDYTLPAADDEFGLDSDNDEI